MSDKVWPKAVVMACGCVGWRLTDVVEFRIGRYDVAVINRKGQKCRFLLEKLGVAVEEAGKVESATVKVSTTAKKKPAPRRPSTSSGRGRSPAKTGGPARSRAVGSVSDPNRRNGTGRK